MAKCGQQNRIALVSLRLPFVVERMNDFYSFQILIYSVPLERTFDRFRSKLLVGDF